jgi:predicted transcriptional regulator of viral defense system
VLIARLARGAQGGLIDVATAGRLLGTTSRNAALKLAALTRRGWLRRARRGLYLIAPLEVEPGKQAGVEDPWVLAQQAFSPCYIGGWSAAEHWGLTEQIFRSTVVVTAASVRSTKATLLGQEFRLFRVPVTRMESIVSVWRGSHRVRVSSRERTIIDSLRNPELCGGMRTVASILAEYSRRPEADITELLTEARAARSGAVWKRLGYLLELCWPQQEAAIAEARQAASSGVIRLDPNVAGKGKLQRRWSLWGNVRLGNDPFSE